MWQDLSIQIVEDFVDVQRAWQDRATDRARLRFEIRLAEQRKEWEETRRVTLATNADLRNRRRSSQSEYEKRRWKTVSNDPEKRKANAARRMASYYRNKR